MSVIDRWLEPLNRNVANWFRTFDTGSVLIDIGRIVAVACAVFAIAALVWSMHTG